MAATITGPVLRGLNTALTAARRTGRLGDDAAAGVALLRAMARSIDLLEGQPTTAGSALLLQYRVALGAMGLLAPAATGAPADELESIFASSPS